MKKFILILAGMTLIAALGALSYALRSARPIETTATQLPAQYGKVEGIIVSSDADTLQIRSKNILHDYDISTTTDIQAIVAGSIEEGNTSTVNTTKDDLVPQKEVILFVETGSNRVRSIYVLK